MYDFRKGDDVMYYNPYQSNQSIMVHSEDEAWNFPIAQGQSLILIDENEPYIYTKSMGLSQLDKPVFEKYKLVKVESQKAAPAEYATKQDLVDLRNFIEQTMKGSVTHESYIEESDITTTDDIADTE